MDDQKIIEFFFARSEDAIAALSQKYGGACHRLAGNILGNSRDAEECVNDAYLGCWNTIPPRRPNPLSSYVLRITRNLAIGRYHKNTALKRNSHYDAALEELSEVLPAADTAETVLEAAELTAALNRFLDKLDRRERAVFLRRYWYGESVSAIAVFFDLRANTVSQLLGRTRKKLAKFLEKEDWLRSSM